MKDPAATFRSHVYAVFSESPYVIISVLSISDEKASMVKFGRKTDTQNWCRWEGEESPQQGRQTMEIVSFESQELNQGNFSIQLFLFFYYQHNMLPHVFFSYLCLVLLPPTHKLHFLKLETVFSAQV